MPHLKRRSRYVEIDELDRYRLLKFICTGEIFRAESTMHTFTRGFADLRGLINGEFPDADVHYCRGWDEGSQRRLWEIFRADILEARRKHAPGMKIWGSRFDR